MANPEHLAILRQGAEVWNPWRRQHVNQWADLRGTDLRGIELFSADLFKVDLRGCNLQRARLFRADLRGADLQGADLTQAHLITTNFSGADLSGADLSGANLYEANLYEANLHHTNFHAARVGGTVFGGLDLRTVYGLDTLFYDYPSTISIDTFYHSKGQIPESFLRGCGVPDSMIEYARSLVTAAHPIDYYSCFISYSSKDEALAKRLHADLQAAGVRCWFAPHDLPIGARIRVGIDEAIRLHDKLLLLLSKHSVASDWVEKEVETAMEQERRQKRTVLFPIRLDSAVMKIDSGWAADVRRGRNIGDFCKWKQHDQYEAAFARLLRDLQAMPAR